MWAGLGALEYWSSSLLKKKYGPLRNFCVFKQPPGPLETPFSHLWVRSRDSQDLFLQFCLFWEEVALEKRKEKENGLNGSCCMWISKNLKLHFLALKVIQLNAQLLIQNHRKVNWGNGIWKLHSIRIRESWSGLCFQLTYDNFSPSIILTKSVCMPGS